MRRKILILSVVTGLAAVGFRKAEFGGTVSGKNIYTVVTESYGVNSEGMEFLVTNPLENSIADLPGIRKIRSTSEYSNSRIEVDVEPSMSSGRFLPMITDRVERAGAKFPSTVRRSQIYHTAGNAQPAFIAAFRQSSEEINLLRGRVERNVKPLIERMSGVGRVRVWGGGTEEIQIKLAPGWVERFDLTPDSVGVFLQSVNRRIPLGLSGERPFKAGVLLEGRMSEPQEIGEILIGKEKRVPLKRMASIRREYRAGNLLNRLDGEEVIGLSVEASGGANLVALSRRLGLKLDEFRDAGYRIDIVHDPGARMKSSIRDVLLAVLAGLLGLSFFLFAGFHAGRAVFHLAISLPLIGFFSLSTLSFLDISISQSILSGMALGMGMMVDSALVVADSLIQGERRFFKIAPAPVISTLTTGIAFLPLRGYWASRSEMGLMLLSFLILLTLSLVYYLLLFPDLSGLKKSEAAFSSRIFKHILAPPLRLIRFCAEHPGPVLAGSAVVILISAIGLFVIPWKIGGTPNQGTLFVRLEMESGASVNSVDKRTQRIVRKLRKEISEVRTVESLSRSGQGRLTVLFNPRLVKAEFIFETIKSICLTVPNVFPYKLEGEWDGRNWIELTLTGGEIHVLRRLAADLVQSAQKKSWVQGGVLHFKEPPPAFVFLPEFEKLSRSSLSVSEVARFIRWSVQGPVVLKWYENGTEKDLRVFFSDEGDEGNKTLESLNHLKIKKGSGKAGGGATALSQLGTWELRNEPSRIFHHNRQRAVSFSLLTDERNLKKLIRSAVSFIEDSDLPRGYGLFYEGDLDEKRREYRTLWRSIISALLLVYGIMAIQSNSFMDPVLMIAIVPLSTAFPLIFFMLRGKSLGVSSLMGIIILCGMAVNNAILILSRFRDGKTEGVQGIVEAVLSRYRSLILTTGTTLLGIIPLTLISQSGSGGEMGLILMMGLAGSFLSSVTFFPALMTMAPAPRKAAAPPLQFDLSI